jgi:hypothetical protein
MDKILPPLRAVKQENQGHATVYLECGHSHDRPAGFHLPKRMRCATCLPLDLRLAYMKQRQR